MSCQLFHSCPDYVIRAMEDVRSEKLLLLEQLTADILDYIESHERSQNSLPPWPPFFITVFDSVKGSGLLADMENYHIIVYLDRTDPDERTVLIQYANALVNYVSKFWFMGDDGMTDSLKLASIVDSHLFPAKESES